MDNMNQNLGGTTSNTGYSQNTGDAPYQQAPYTNPQNPSTNPQVQGTYQNMQQAQYQQQAAYQQPQYQQAPYQQQAAYQQPQYQQTPYQQSPYMQPVKKKHGIGCFFAVLIGVIALIAILITVICVTVFSAVSSHEESVLIGYDGIDPVYLHSTYESDGISFHEMRSYKEDEPGSCQLWYNVLSKDGKEYACTDIVVINETDPLPTGKGSSSFSSEFNGTKVEYESNGVRANIYYDDTLISYYQDYSDIIGGDDCNENEYTLYSSSDRHGCAGYYDIYSVSDGECYVAKFYIGGVSFTAVSHKKSNLDAFAQYIMLDYEEEPEYCD